MAYLNKQERERLRSDLMTMSYNQAKGRINRMDPKGRLRYWRNAQRVGEWHTRFDLEGLGTTVTLVETPQPSAPDENQIAKRKFDLVDVRVDALPGNRT